MAIAVTTVASGGLPVTDVTATNTKLGLHVAEVTKGLAVTKGPGGLPVNFAPVSDWPPVGGGGGGGPPGVTGMKGWWDASVTASLTLTGSNITAIADQSGAGNNLTSTANDPIYNATGLNGRPTMVFSALNHVFSKTGFALGGNTLTAFAVMRMNAACPSYGRVMAYWLTDDYGTVTGFFMGRDSGNVGATIYRSGSTAVKPITTTTPHRVIVTVAAGGALQIYVDGIAGTTSGIVGNFAATGTLALGNGSTGVVSAFAGEISEIGIATGFSDPAAVALLDAQLKTKWGL